jgi:hypothetical protein
VVKSYIKSDEVVSPLTPRKYTVLNGSFVFDLHDVFQESIPGVKRDSPVYQSHRLMLLSSVRPEINKLIIIFDTEVKRCTLSVFLRKVSVFLQHLMNHFQCVFKTHFHCSVYVINYSKRINSFTPVHKRMG